MADIMQEVRKIAEEYGFSHIGDLRVENIKLRAEAREACAVNKCGAYGKTWACPPGCGDLEECAARLGKYQRGLILQSTAELEDNFDSETMMNVAFAHGKRVEEFRKKLMEQYQGPFLFFGSAGACGEDDGSSRSNACGHCKECTYPDAPCRFPDRANYKLEGFGMIVSELCRDNNIPYYYGPLTITYTGAVLIE